METTQKEIIEKQIKKLPKDIRDAIIATDLPNKFKTISTKHALRIDQATALETETMLVLLGLEHPDDYTKNLMEEANLLHDKAEKIAEETSRMIFLPIRTSLQKFHEAEKEKFGKEAKAAEEEKPEERIDRRTSKTDSVSTSSDTSLQIPEPDIFREKLEKQMHMAKTETSVHKPDAETIHTALKTPKADPYREPIEKKDTVGIRQEGLPKETITERNSTSVSPAPPAPPTSSLLEHKTHLTMTPKPTPALARDQDIAGGPKAPPPRVEKVQSKPNEPKTIHELPKKPPTPPPNLPSHEKKTPADPYRETIEK